MGEMVLNSQSSKCRKYKNSQHAKISTKLSLDSLTMKASHLKVKLSERSSYLTDSLSSSSRRAANYSSLIAINDDKDEINRICNDAGEIVIKKQLPSMKNCIKRGQIGLKSFELVDIPYCGPYTPRRRSLPTCEVNKNESSLSLTNNPKTSPQIAGSIKEEISTDVERSRKRTVPVIYGDSVLQIRNNSRAQNYISPYSLRRVLTLYSSFSFLIGTVIGSGIFMASPGFVYSASGSSGMTMLSWFVCGIIALLGAKCYAELGTEIKISGSEFAYLGHAIGNVPAFLYLWTSVLIVRPSSIAIVAMSAGQILSKEISGGTLSSEGESKCYALACIGKNTSILIIICFVLISLEEYTKRIIKKVYLFNYFFVQQLTLFAQSLDV